ncbi:hypothetical protein [Neobacillus sp. CF12]|uniref:hypothetical protein n=1 Tax=Neobacillus sp. CF12 TaxID=3055864 RepID=UPI0025A16785|nr:hypothetical protein [Neobacillus sp. CF12]MDM5330442.1 hypothetical protein [Neobacillus sp. CF12]
MLSNFSKAIHEGKFASNVYLSLDGIQINQDELILTIQVTYENDDEKLQVWKVICTEFRDHKLSVNYFEEFEVLDNHVFLWEHNNDSATLYFKGHCKDINQIIGELYLTHSNIVNKQLPLETYINIIYPYVYIEHLLKGGEGLFSSGPANLIKAYEKVLSGNGYKTTIFESTSQKSTLYKIFIFGDSYVVAKDFQDIRIL